jgi:hypothetical protein
VPVPPAVRAPGRGRTVAGGVIMLLGATMPWIHIEGAGDTSSFKIPFEFLFNANANNLDQGGFTVGLVLVALALGAMFSAVAKGSPRIRKVLGRGAMLIAIVYGGQLFQVLDSLGASSEAFKVLGVGVYVTFVGGVLTSWGKK